MPPTCKLQQIAAGECTSKARTNHFCSSCHGAYHRNCGQFTKITGSKEEGALEICFECMKLPKYKDQQRISAAQTTAGASGANKKRKIHQVSGEGTRPSSPSESSSDKQSSDDEESIPENATPADVMRAMRREFKVIKRDFKSSISTLKTDLSGKISGVMSSNEGITKEQKRQAGDIRFLKRDGAEVRSSIHPEISISGHEGTTDANVDLKKLFVDLARFLEVKLEADDIRRTSLLKPRSNSQSERPDNAAPPGFVVTLYSASHALKILDARHKRTKILNSDIINGSTSNRQIFINNVVKQETYRLLQTVKSWARNHGFRFVWQTEGRVLLRKQERARVIQINSEEDLDDLEKKHPAVQTDAPTETRQPRGNSTNNI